MERLERGRFARLCGDEADTPITMTVGELDLRPAARRTSGVRYI
jgi:hypothetical protein